eukprot:1440877-Lingulodinium_polyedra.AAC.1
MQSRHPQKALDITEEIWKYIKSTADYVMDSKPNVEAENDIRISATRALLQQETGLAPAW